MAKPRVISSEANIVELPDGGGWLLAWTPADVERHGSAAEALAAVREMQRVLVEGGAADISACRITWEPKTRIGKLVVKVLTT